MDTPGGDDAQGGQPRDDAVMPPDLRKLTGGICHRVKNDLQTIHYMLTLSRPYAHSAQELATVVQGRVITLSLCYAMVSETGQPPDLDRLVEEVLRRNLGRGPTNLRLERRLSPVSLSLRICSPLCLWLHEVIGNALAHGLNQVSDPWLVLEAGLDEQGLRLCVTDNGPGLPPGFDPSRDGRLGLKLVHGLSHTDLRGSLELSDAQPGLRAELRMPAAEYARLTSELWW